MSMIGLQLVGGSALDQKLFVGKGHGGKAPALSISSAAGVLSPMVSLIHY